MSNQHPTILRGLDAAAQFIGLGIRKTWELRAANALPHKRCGRALLFDTAELRAWLDAGCPSHPNAAEDVRRAMGKGATDERA